LAAVINTQTALTVSTVKPNYVGFWLRVVAALIDHFLCQVVTVIVAFPLGFTMGASMATTFPLADIEFAATGIGFIIGLAVQWLWFTVGESSKWQASVGKKILGFKVTDLRGNRIDFIRANGRYWSKLLSGLFFGLGFLMVAFSGNKQGLHDKLAGTLVVKDRDQ
jgi:uncharacterized RDD family membrane protein YckC